MIILDIESSGTNPQKHSILSIGAIDFSKPENTFYEECRLWEGSHVDDQALKINGFNQDDIRDEKKQTEGEVVESFLNWARESSDHTIAGHNPSFDLFFVQAGAERNSLNFFLAHRVIDLHSICYFHMLRRGVKPPERNQRTDLNSDTVMKYVGVPTEPKPHNALNGAKWETEAFHRLFFDKSLFSDFDGFNIPWKDSL